MAARDQRNGCWGEAFHVSAFVEARIFPSLSLRWPAPLGSRELGTLCREIRKTLCDLTRIKALIGTKLSAGDRALIAVRE